MSRVEAFVGIDVAFAKRKRLPIALCVWDQGRLKPFHLGDRNAPEPPRGQGNVAATYPAIVECFCNETAIYLHQLETHFDVSIRRIGIDAPSDPRLNHLQRRAAEQALDDCDIRCFATPSIGEFEIILQKVRTHLGAGGRESRLPHANQLWMLVGFALFARLRREWNCIEVFPQATIFRLGASTIHKSKVGGVSSQLAAVARYTGWPDRPDEAELKNVVRGPAHDGLDAYMAAWVAALEEESRIALGIPPNDVIWVPSVSLP